MFLVSNFMKFYCLLIGFLLHSRVPSDLTLNVNTSSAQSQTSPTLAFGCTKSTTTTVASEVQPSTSSSSDIIVLSSNDTTQNEHLLSPQSQAEIRRNVSGEFKVSPDLTTSVEVIDRPEEDESQKHDVTAHVSTTAGAPGSCYC